MKTIKLQVLKKNRVYFKCVNETGYEVKLKVTPKSENLELGTHELLVNDVSVRTKYGTDIIYDLESEIKEDGIVTLKHRYNTTLVEKCRELGGKWDSDSKAWVFSKMVEDKVEELEALYCGDEVVVEITAVEDRFGSQGPVTWEGYPLAKATGRDSGATMCEGVSMTEGKIGSGGSVKNWGTEVLKGTKFRLSISHGLLENADTDRFTYEVIG